MSTVSVWCAHCSKPMVMLSFNYTSLERGFESVSLRCQYCGVEETRPWPKEDAQDPTARDEPSERGSDDQGLLNDELNESAAGDETRPLKDDEQTEGAPVVQTTVESSPADGPIENVEPHSTVVTARQAGWYVNMGQSTFSFRSGES